MPISTSRRRSSTLLGMLLNNSFPIGQPSYLNFSTRSFPIVFIMARYFSASSKSVVNASVFSTYACRAVSSNTFGSRLFSNTWLPSRLIVSPTSGISEMRCQRSVMTTRSPSVKSPAQASLNLSMRVWRGSFFLSSVTSVPPLDGFSTPPPSSKVRLPSNSFFSL